MRIALSIDFYYFFLVCGAFSLELVPEQFTPAPERVLKVKEVWNQGSTAIIIYPHYFIKVKAP